MNDSVTLGVFVAFSAGLLSFLSPCVLPLVPSYMAFLTGMTPPDAANRRRITVTHALFFVLGFSAVFLALGAGASALGAALKSQQLLIERIGGVLIIIFGLWMLGVLKLDFLQREQRLQVEDKPVGYLGSSLVGMAFAAGWVPCIGPILGAILGLAATEADFSRGMALLGAYSAGLALPFLLAAFALDRFLEWFTGFRRHLGTVKVVSGVLLLAVGLLMVTGQFTQLAGWLSNLTPDFIRERI
ncbi:MAG TPA: cytochrome c biogenesis CcdA family protein [Gemmatimonadales bacterium]|nr:cytochrome c biogenesis CcdA family protein [Gemmatimonadales bacterium]